MDRLQRLFGNAGAGLTGAGDSHGPAADTPKQDTGEQIHISSLALLKVPLPIRSLVLIL